MESEKKSELVASRLCNLSQVSFLYLSIFQYFFFFFFVYVYLLSHLKISSTNFQRVFRIKNVILNEKTLYRK